MVPPYPTDMSGQTDRQTDRWVDARCQNVPTLPNRQVRPSRQVCVCMGGRVGGGGSETYSEASWILRSGSRAAEPILLTDSIVTLLWSSESGTQEEKKYRSALSLSLTPSFLPSILLLLLLSFFYFSPFSSLTSSPTTVSSL